MTFRFGKNGVLDYIVDRTLTPDYIYLDIPEEADYDYSGYDIDSDMSTVKLSGGHLPMRRKVYNLEVSDTHTYFVTRLGLWVHNTSGASLPLNPAENLGVYIGRERVGSEEKGPIARFSDRLKQQPDGRGFGIIPGIGETSSGGVTQALVDGSIRGPLYLAG